MIVLTVTIYNYSDDFFRLDKSNFLTTVSTHTGTIRDYVDIVNPSILVEGNVKNGNYCYIDSFSGYYWITEKTIVRNNLTELKLKRDASMTFLSGILNSDCICSRNTNKYNSDYNDNRYVTKQNKYIETFAVYPLSNDDCIVFAFIE